MFDERIRMLQKGGTKSQLKKMNKRIKKSFQQDYAYVIISRPANLSHRINNDKYIFNINDWSMGKV